MNVRSESIASGSANQPSSSVTPTAASAPEARHANSSGSSTSKTAGYVSLGVGAAGVVVGGIFAVRSHGLRGDADDYAKSVRTLPGGGCPLDQRPKIDSMDSKADSARNIAVAGFVVGGVGIAAGVTMLLVAPSKPPQAAFLLPYFSASGAGVYGQF